MRNVLRLIWFVLRYLIMILFIKAGLDAKLRGGLDVPGINFEYRVF